MNSLPNCPKCNCLIYNAPDDHDIDCKIDGFGAMKLKSSVVKKA